MRTILLVFFTLLSIHLSAQTAEKKEPKKLEPIRWIVKPSFHVFVPFSSGKSPAEKLISFNKPQISFTAISIARYSEHWGVEAELYVGNAINTDNSAFAKALTKEFGSQYYISSSGQDFYDDTNVRFMVGPGYKTEHGRLFYTYKFLIGVSSYYASTGRVALKEINGNERRTISWQSAGDSPAAFTINSAMTVGYRVHSHLSITGSVGLWLQGSNAVYTEYTSVLNNANVTARTLNYDSPKVLASFGIGMAFSW